MNSKRIFSYEPFAAGAVGLYRLAGWAGTPAVRLLLRRRLARGREDALRLGERWGQPTAARPPGPLLWIHAASVGESLSALPLAARLRADRPELGLLVTTGSVTSARLMGERLPEGAVHQYLPVDLPGPTGRFIDHWRPALGLFVESEFWPSLLTAAGARKVPLVLVNGRMSPASFASWRRARPLIGRLLGHFSLLLTQSPADAERLRALGAPAPRCLGNLKCAAPAPPLDDAELAGLRAAFGGRPRWLAASTHPGEELAAAEVHDTLAPRFPGLVTVIAPRHPDRGAEIAAQLAARGLRVARRSAGERPGPRHQVYLADTIGELGLLYGACEIAFVGGSLVPKGGQNLLEPAKLGCAILAGPHCGNFASIAEEMTSCGALCQLDGAESLAAEVGRLLADSGRRTAMIAAADSYARRQDDVLEALLRAIAPYLPPAPAR